MADYIDKEVALALVKPDAPEDEKAAVTIATAKKLVRSIVRRTPAADVAPVVHGRWDGDNCTVCKLPWNYNMTQNADDWGYFDPMPDYCPNCGAKMDKVE